ncbi:autophagy protein 16 [Naviculisporaceae sp. PSN 640]
MAGWREEYLAGIREAEQRNPANLELIDTCSQLADRVSALEAEKTTLLLQLQQYQQQQQQSNTPTTTPNTQTATTSTPENDSQSLTLAKLRLELTTALRSQTTTQSRLQALQDEHARLKHKSALEAQTLRDLTKEHKQLQLKFRDCNEELRDKSKLLRDVHDEIAVLNLQLNVTEQRRKEQEEENKQLIERFMRRVGQEAEAMNLANEPLFGGAAGRTGGGGGAPSSSRRDKGRR